mgnify:CR=1 FL=1
MAQGTDECLDAPMLERCVICQVLSARGPAGGRGMLVLTEVSSMKASLSKCLAMKGWRLPIHMRRGSATPCRFRASAPVSRRRRTMSLTNLIDTHNRRAVSVRA